jgi:cell division protease FtsH
LPDEENRFLKQKHELLAEVDVLLAGRAAEDVFLGEISTGASNDLQRATDILKAMISVYGMSNVAGLMVLERSSGGNFLGGGQTIKDYSEKTAEAIDNAIRSMLDTHYQNVKDKLKVYRGAIEEMVGVLMDVEVIEGHKVREIIENFEKDNGMDSQLAHGEKVAKEEATKNKNEKTE